MLALLTAIQSRFAAANLGATGKITGGLHFELAPPGAAMPYAVTHLISSPTTVNYSGAGFTEPQIDFVVRGTGGPAAVLALCEQVKAAFKDQLLTLTSGAMLNSVLTNDPIPEPSDPTRDEQGNDSFGWIVSFRFSVAN